MFRCSVPLTIKFLYHLISHIYIKEWNTNIRGRKKTGRNLARKWLRHHRKRVALPTTNFCPQCTCEPVVTCITALSTVSKYVHARDYQFVVRPRTSKIVNMRVCVNLGTCMHESISSPYHAPFPLPVNVGSSSSSLLWRITFSSLFVIDVIDRKIEIMTRSLDS